MPSIINSDNGATSGSAGLKFASAADGVLEIQNNGVTAITVGNTGQATFTASVSQPGGFSFRNRLINAQGLINQRVYASGTNTSGVNQYTVDRWRVVTSGQNLAFTTSENNTTFTAPAGGVEQVIEGLNLETGTYVLSWTGTATATVGGVPVTNGETVSVTGGTNTTIRFSGGTFSKPQFEPGTAPTTFERRPFGMELSLCQRYFIRSDNSGTLKRNYNWSGGVIAIPQSGDFPVVMRAIPTMTVTGDISDGPVVTLGNAGSAATRYSYSVYQNISNNQFVDLVHYLADAEL